MYPDAINSIIMYAIRAVWNSIAPPKVCTAIELARVVAPKVIPVTNSPTTRGTVHLFILKRLYAVIKLKIPRTGMCRGAAKFSNAK